MANTPTEALVLIHTDQSNVRDTELRENTGRENEALFNRIAQAAPQALNEGKAIYYCPESSEPKEETLYEGLRAYTSLMESIPFTESVESQLLSTKRRMIQDGIARVTLAGILHEECIAKAYHLFRGERAGIPEDANDLLGQAAEFLNLPNDDLENLLYHPMRVIIGEGLTDGDQAPSTIPLYPGVGIAPYLRWSEISNELSQKYDIEV